MKAFDHLAFMKNPNSWPNLVLPIKRYSKDRHIETAVVFIANDGQYSVAFGCNMFALAEGTETANWEKTTPEALVANGWLVD